MRLWVEVAIMGATTYKGVVRGNAVVLEEKPSIPDGTAVEVILVLPHIPENKEDAIDMVLRHGSLNAPYRVDIDRLIEEDRKEREEGGASWLSSQ
jgi:hypothetical protein